ncbi:MAG: hypothetical protein ACXV8O_12715 [Methylobacter sp.]
MQNNVKPPSLVNSGSSKPVKHFLFVLRMMGIVILGSYLGMWAHSLLNQEPQGYSGRAIQLEKQPLEKETSSQNAEIKKAHNKVSAKHKTEVVPVVIGETLTSADNEHSVADELKIPNVSDIVARFIGSPYFTLQIEGDRLM